MDLLEQLIDFLHRGSNIPLKHSFLIASGIKDKSVGDDYLRKFDKIHSKYDIFAKKKYGNNMTALKRAQALSEYLTSPVRYDSNKSLFNEVIDARLSSSPFVGHGNCLGLTCLYNALAEEDNILTGIYKRIEHVFTRAFIDNRQYAIENTSPFGFDIKIDGLVGVGSNLDLLSGVLMVKRESNDEEFLRRLNLAKIISPKMSLIYFNSSKVYCNLERLEEALEDINHAIEINPFDPEEYSFRSEIKNLMGDRKGARNDRKKSREVKRSYASIIR
jgi:tetratricopeptide (TPR) repeat protein